MVRVISGQSRNHQENFRGNSDSLPRRLSYTSSPSIGAPQQRQGIRSSASSSHATGISCHRGCVRPVVTRLLQQTVPISSQAQRDFPSDHRFEEAHPLPRGSIIQNGNSVLHHSSTPASGMDHQDRLEGRLPSHLGTSQHPEILSVRDIRKDLSIQDVSAWANDGAKRVHQNIGSGIPVIENQRDHSSCLSWWLDHQGRQSGTLFSACSRDHTSSTIIGVDDKLEEISSRTLTYTRISRPSFQPRTGHYISTQVISRETHQRSISSVYTNHHVCSENHFHQQQNIALCFFIHHGWLQLCFLQFWIKQRRSQHAQPWDSPIQLNQEYISHLHGFCRWQEQQIMGQWSPLEQLRHIIWLRNWKPSTWPFVIGARTGFNKQSVCIATTAHTAVAYIRKQVGTHSLSLFHKTLELFQLLDKFVTILVPTHLPGARNLTADALSRLNSPSPM